MIELLRPVSFLVTSIQEHDCKTTTCRFSLISNCSGIWPAGSLMGHE
jgi:hypothetical protein